MPAFVVKNASFWISNGATSVAVSAATKGTKTAIVAVNTLAAGDYAVVNGSGWGTLDGIPGKVSASPAPTSTGFSLEIDTNSETATINAGTKFVPLAGANWLEACVSGFDIAGGQSDSIGVGTFCDSSAALAGSPAASTVTLTGFIDVGSSGFMEIGKAANDGLPRYFKFIMPQAADPTGSARPVMTFGGTVGIADQSFQTGAAATFTNTVALSSRPVITRTA